MNASGAGGDAAALHTSSAGLGRSMACTWVPLAIAGLSIWMLLVYVHVYSCRSSYERRASYAGDGGAEGTADVTRP